MLRFRKSKEKQITDISATRRSIRPQKTTPNIFAYHSNRSSETITHGRHQLKDTINTKVASKIGSYIIQRFGLLILILVVIVSLINVLLVAPRPKIVLINPNQVGFLHSTSVYEQAAQKLLSGSLSNDNKITINTASISSSLQKQFPELTTIIIKLPLVGQQPAIYLGHATALLALFTATNIYVVDSGGRVLGNTDAANINTLHLIEIQDNNVSNLKVGQLILSANTISFIQTVIFQVQQKNLVISHLVLPAGESELDMFATGQSYYVKFNLNNNDPTEQVGTFIAVRHNLQERGITPSQYIDVRVDGRAYYK
ncbi:MAG: hypothetical protein ACREF5_00325 [Candidatus Saccharimonadales bacterium]